MSKPSLEVFKTDPLLMPKVWGGRKLAVVFGKTLPDDQPYGESWEVADLDEGQSAIATGSLAGEPLRVAVELFGRDLIGTATADDRFPLLVKLLDAAADLSVQVHPGADDVVSRPGAKSKDECWVVLDADVDAAIIHGLRAPTDTETFRRAASDGTVLDLLHRVPVAPRDVFRVPPGTIHAICAGVALLEIQQPSDTTYRVYDYGRLGLDQKPRPLHLDDALDVAYLGPTLPEERGLDVSTGPLARGVRVLANVDAYRVELLAIDEDLSWPVSAHSPQVVHVLRGHLCLDDLLLGPSETAIIPAALGRVWLTQPDDCEIVVAGLGGPPLVSG